MSIMVIIGLVNGTPTAFDGQYLLEYDPGRDGVDPDGRQMTAHLVTTPDLREALRLETAEMFDLWTKVDPRTPVRPDGKPNRPLSAFTIQIVNE